MFLGCTHTIAGVNNWWSYVEEVTRDAQQVAVAIHADIDKSHITRWKQGHEPGVHFVVKFARAYGRNPLEAMVAAGFITADEAQLREVRVGAEDLTDDQLIDEIRARMR